MLSAYKYHFYPSRERVRVLEQTLRLCSTLYNTALEQRRYASEFGQPISYRIQQNELPQMKEGLPQCSSVHSQVLQNVLLRVDREDVTHSTFRIIPKIRARIGSRSEAARQRFQT